MTLLIIVAVLALLSLLVVWMAGGMQSPRTFRSAPLRVLSPDAQTKTSTDTVNVLVWNVAWGYGWGSEGSGGAKPKPHFEKSIEKMGGIIKRLNADIVLLQEVDFRATRSGHQDQAKALAKHAGLPYVAKAESWTANWVPFPYWPPSNHFGQMSSGGAVLSRFPITDNEVELLPKPAEYPFWYRMFYLFRFFQRTEITIGQTKLSVFNAHLEAFNTTNRQAQAQYLSAKLSKKKEATMLFGGDMNSIPPESKTRKAFSDDSKGNFEQDRTVAILRSIEGMRDSLPPEQFSANERAFYTFPAHQPNRKLDFLFHNEGLEVLEVKVPKTIAGDVSDHLPLLVKMRVKALTSRP